MIKVTVTSGGSSGLVFDDVDFIDKSKLFEHGEELSIGHVLRHLTHEQLHTISGAAAAGVWWVLAFRHECQFSLSLSFVFCVFWVLMVGGGVRGLW